MTNTPRTNRQEHEQAKSDRPNDVAFAYQWAKTLEFELEAKDKIIRELKFQLWDAERKCDEDNDI